MNYKKTMFVTRRSALYQLFSIEKQKLSALGLFLRKKFLSWEDFHFFRRRALWFKVEIRVKTWECKL